MEDPQARKDPFADHPAVRAASEWGPPIPRIGATGLPLQSLKAPPPTTADPALLALAISIWGEWLAGPTLDDIARWTTKEAPSPGRRPKLAGQSANVESRSRWPPSPVSISVRPSRTSTGTGPNSRHGNHLPANRKRPLAAVGGRLHILYTKSMAQDLIRAHETDSQWHATLHAFIHAAEKARRGILIDYVYEPPSRIVPQRLYRYDLFPDYVSRHRDDFEFGFDLITAARAINPRRTYGVYVIEINGNPNHVYVGQTWYSPDERLQQHLTGLSVFHAAKPFKRATRAGAEPAGRLRPDLYAHIPRVRSQPQAEELESRLAMELRRAGFRVEGGH